MPPQPTHPSSKHTPALNYTPDADIGVFRTISYEPKGTSDTHPIKKRFFANPVNKQLYATVVSKVHVPDDFDTSSTFGPRSGLCHEQRVVFFYAPVLNLCTTCGAQGHLSLSCPAVFTGGAQNGQSSAAPQAS